MKKLNLIPKSLLGAIIVSTLLVTGCSKESQLGDVSPSETETSVNHSNLKKATSDLAYTFINAPTDAVTVCGDVSSTDFIANSNTTGSLEISNDAENVYVDIKSIAGLNINSVKLYVGDLAGVPLNNGENPKLGHYPIKTDVAEGAIHLQYKFAIADLVDNFVVSAKAEISGLDSWATETQFSAKNNPAGYVSYTKQECESGDDFMSLDAQSYAIKNYFGSVNTRYTLEVRNDVQNIYITLKSQAPAPYGYIYDLISAVVKPATSTYPNFPYIDDRGFSLDIRAFNYSVYASSQTEATIICPINSLSLNGQNEVDFTVTFGASIYGSNYSGNIRSSNVSDINGQVISLNTAFYYDKYVLK